MGVTKTERGKKNLPYNYSKLIGRMAEMGETRESLSKKIGLSSVSLRAKLQNKTQFKQGDIAAISEVLEIPTEDIVHYFFSV